MELEVDKWKEFYVKDIFIKKEIKKCQSKPNKLGNIPYVTSKSINNGVDRYVSAEGLNSFICKSNNITVSTNGNCFDCFYHDENIIISSDIEILYLNNLNENIALFLITILNKQSEKYSYGFKNKKNAVWETKIPLPTDEFGNPDWKFMEDYIKELKERERERVATFFN